MKSRGSFRMLCAKVLCGLMVLSLPLLIATPSNASYQAFYSMVAQLPQQIKTALFTPKPKGPPTRQELWEGVLSASRQYDVKPSLVWAVMAVGSDFDQDVVSPHGAVGLMQLMPSTAKEMGIENPHDPYENIVGGTRYLRYLLDRFNGDKTLAVAAYRAGPSLVERYKGVPPRKSTQQFVKRVMAVANQTA